MGRGTDQPEQPPGPEPVPERPVLEPPLPERPAPERPVAGAPGLTAGLELIDAGLDRATPRCWVLPDAEVRDALLKVGRQLARLEALRLAIVRELDGRPGAVPGARADQVAATFLIHAGRLAPGQARRDVAAAHALDPDTGPLPQLGAALAAGDVSRAQVDVAVRAVDRLPTQLRACGGDRIDAFLTEQARRFTPPEVEKLARHLLAVLDPDGTNRYDPNSYARRSVTSGWDSSGMLVGRFQLDPAGGAIVQAALTAFARPDPTVSGQTEDGQEVLVADERSSAQRNADALVAIARAGLRGAPDEPGTEPSSRVLVIATPEQVAAAAEDAPTAGAADCIPAGPVSPGTFGRLACDSVLQKVLLAPDGAVLALGRGVRSVSPAQRRALIARGGGCVIPGCTAPVHACEAHHLRPWQAGGTTDLHNLALTCHRHHSALHAGVWSIQVHADGTVWVIPPAWIDGQRRPIRAGALGRAAGRARQLGRQLRLKLEPG